MDGAPEYDWGNVEFWSPAKSEFKVCGELTISDHPQALLDHELFPLNQVTLTEQNGLACLAYSGSPKKIVEDFKPRDCCFYSSELQKYGFLVGAQASLHHGNIMERHKERLQANKWWISNSEFPSPIQVNRVNCKYDLKCSPLIADEDETCVNIYSDSGDSSEVRVRILRTDDGALSVRMQCERPIKIELWLNSILRPLESLLSGMTDVDVKIMSICASNSEWEARYYESNFSTGTLKKSKIVAAESLTNKIIAKWLNEAQRVGQIPYYLVPDAMPIQVSAFLLSSALEGLHRRSVPGTQGIKKLGRNPRNKLRREVRELVRCKYGENQKLSEKEITFLDNKVLGAFSHLEDPTFEMRLKYWVETYESRYQFLFGPDSDKWMADVKHIRNHESHLFAATDANPINTLDRDHNRYITYHYSLRLLVRVIILELAGFDSEWLRDEILSSKIVEYDMANLDQEGYWLGYSAYDELKILQTD